MSVPVETFKDVLFGAAVRCGLLPESDDGLSAEEKAKFLEFGNSAGKICWEFYPWPDAMDLREEAIGTHPTVTGARYVARSSATRTLKVVVAVWDKDPRVAGSPAGCCAQRVNHASLADGLYFYDSTLTTVWVEYRPAAPKWTVTPWLAATAYAAGTLRWNWNGADGDGHVYKALQAVTASPAILISNTAFWEPVPVLACLADAIKAGIVGAYHATEGQHGTGRVKEEYMRELLEHEILQLQNQSGLTTSYQ